MKASERRRKILELVEEKGQLSYKEILDEVCELANPVEILCDLDTLVFFKFLQHAKSNVKKGPDPKSILELRPHPQKKGNHQIKGNKVIVSQLKKLDLEIPPWYRKLAILTALEKAPAEPGEILHILKVQWPSQIVNTSLRILESYGYISRMGNKLQKFKLTAEGENILKESSFKKVSKLKKLENEFVDEFKTFTIVNIVRTHGKIGRGITTGKIIALLQKTYGKRGNKRRAVRKTLDKMVYSGLLTVSEGKRGLMEGSYTLGSTALSLFEIKPEVNGMNAHNFFEDFKKTVEYFFDNYKIKNFPVERKPVINRILNFIEQYEEDMEIAPKDEWVSHITFLYNCLRRWKGKSWEESETRCIIACILSRLLPPEVAVRVLQEYPPPLPSREQYPHQTGIAREYYFTLTGLCMSVGNYKEAFRSFDHLESLYWESPEFLILKARIEMLRYDVRNPGKFRKIIDIFDDAEKISKGKYKVAVLFHKGLAYHQRGYFKEAIKEWGKCLKLKLFDYQKIMLRHNIAHTCKVFGILKGARNICEKNLKMTRSPKMKKYKVNTLIELADVLIDLCLYDKAKEKLEEAIPICEEIQFVKAEALAKASMGNLLTRRGMCKSALSYLEEAVTLADTGCDPYEYSSILIYLGDTFKKLHMTTEAMDTYTMALALIGRSDLTLMLAAEIKKADIYLDMGNLEKGLELSGAVLKERWVENPRSEAEAHRVQGKAYLLNKDFHKARENLEKSEKIFKKLDLQYELSEVSHLLKDAASH